MTAQIPDSLLWQGHKYSLCVLPLNILFARIQPRPQFQSTSTANWRGYTASWIIEDGKLLLAKINGNLDGGPRRYSFLSDEKPQFGYGTGRYQNLIARIEALPTDGADNRVSNSDWQGSSIPDENGFIPDSAKLAIDLSSLMSLPPKPHFAGWYSGLLRCSYGEQLKYVHGGFGSEYAFDLVIQIEAGIVVKHWIIDNRPGIQARKNQEKIKNTCFSALPDQQNGDALAIQDPVAALNQFSAEHGNMLSAAIRKTIMGHFKKKFIFKEVGDEADLNMRFEFDKAVHAEHRAYMSACVLISIKRKAKDYPDMDLGEYIQIMGMHISFIGDADEVLHKIDIPDHDHLDWALSNLRNMIQLASEEKFDLIGFSHGMARELTSDEELR